MHGYQFSHPSRLRSPSTYFSQSSGVGRLLTSLSAAPPQHVGVVGLGIGTLAAYGRSGDRYRFYEINPKVIELAEEPYSFIKNCPAKCEIVSGDARLALEREDAQQFDVLILDAFSGDSIPVHLLTQEVMELYLSHLKPNGMMAIHISNRYVDLNPVVASLAASHGLAQVLVTDNPRPATGIAPSDWIVLARNAADLNRPTLLGFKPAPIRPGFEPWTDQRNNLFEVLR